MTDFTAPERIALITGATGGIGRAIAGRFAANGFRVVLAGRNAEALATLATEIGGQTETRCYELRDSQATSAALQNFARQHKRLDVLVNAAGVMLDDAANSANVSIQNILVAYAGGDAGPKGAFIEKKEVVLTVGVAPIPEPATWATMATGAILLGFALRRSRA